MTNPVAVVKTVHRSKKDAEGNYTDESEPLYDEVLTYCPGCRSRHPFRIKVYDNQARRNDGTPYPTWEWDGNLERPTFSPSLLCHSSVHVCEGQHAPVTLCDRDFSDCGRKYHGYVWVNAEGEQRFFKIYEEIPEGFEKHTCHTGPDDDPHPADPAWGNCHSFLKDGVWQFLTDSAHHLAGQSVPMEPLPDWIYKP